MPSIFRILGRALFRGDATGSGNAVEIADSSGTNRLVVANTGRVTVSQDTTVTTETCAVITTDTANANLVLAPNGTGAIIADIPDGTTAGGNARGDYAVDLQTSRGSATQVASGLQAVLLGGRNNTASGSRSTVSGDGNTASNDNTTAIGGGSNIAAAADSAIIGGYSARTYLDGQFGRAIGRFAANSDAQTSQITLIRSITGTGISELTLGGTAPAAGTRAILNIASPGPTNARAWRAQIDLVAIVATAGGGGLVINECFMGTYLVGIKRVGANTSLVGTVNTVNEVSDTSMSTSVTTITADDTNEALKIEFTPPTTADGTTVIRVVATAYLTEVGR
jgi:hypothetical protein